MDIDHDSSDDHEDGSVQADDLIACPECGVEVYLDLNDNRCPQCGHWFLEGDHGRMWQQAGGGTPFVYKIAAIVLLLAILLPMLLMLLE